ncbi:AMP-binding protein [Allopusillimonas ginsengisoli]|uniref:AMP-binding protein n=1 Tax=Allopusillimonas ginsengisoli TaxID=453575 RepID=UPI0010C1E7A4|nr:D-alanine--poly(phosphoribitol) ligase [Allopusillimonas ginsengisoli]
MPFTLDFLKSMAHTHGELTAVQHNGVEVSYAEMATAVNALAVALQMLDPSHQSRVGLCASLTLEYLVSVLAIQAASKLPVLLDAQASTEQLHAVLEAHAPTAIIVDEEGDEKINCDNEIKIRISQFEGLVLTYHAHTPVPMQDTSGRYPILKL